MTMEKTDVLVIGGGATGAGVLRDLALRGVDAILVEQQNLAHGTSSRFHGLLHSGARYAVGDPESALECRQENAILKRIARCCVDDTGGLFVLLPGDDPGYANDWFAACRRAGIAAQEIPVAEALSLEPNLNPALERAFRVPDASIDGCGLVWANVGSATGHGARAYTYTRVDRISVRDGSVSGVAVTDLRTGEPRQIECRFIVNAAGAWVGPVARLAGCELKILASKGSLLVFNHRVTNRVVNRLRRPGDGDIIVPQNTVAILGTTSVAVDGPEHLGSSRVEIDRLLLLGRDLVPGLDERRVLRSFAGVRPLYQEGGSEGPQPTDGRAVARQFALVDHQRQGVHGLITVVGGKLTTFRLMAEQTTNLVCAQLGHGASCRTAAEVLLPEATAAQVRQLQRYFSPPVSHKMAGRLGRADLDHLLGLLGRDDWKRQFVCECEQVSLAELEWRATGGSWLRLGDLRCRTRLGMGTCQGTICAARAIGQLYEGGLLDLGRARRLLSEFLDERWKGNQEVLWGDQLRERLYARNVYLNLHNFQKEADDYGL
jgi:glycerol-3-phosphate dehydrogenase